MKTRERLEFERAQKLKRLVDIRFGKIEEDCFDEQGSCWEGYQQIGMKEKDGRMVPNCVPIKENQSKQEFVIPTPEGGEAENAYISRCMSAIAGEYDTQEQALAICYAQLEKK